MDKLIIGRARASFRRVPPAILTFRASIHFRSLSLGGSGGPFEFGVKNAEQNKGKWARCVLQHVVVINLDVG